ncbi:MAG: cell division protein ZapA [Myxococcota bacterium]|jgi:cell division protein ZapA
MKNAAAPKGQLDAPEAIVEEAGAKNPVKRSVTIELAGKQYRLRSDADEEWLQGVAGYVNQAMKVISKRTDTVDSTDVALLTALNIAREVLNLREQVRAFEAAGESVPDRKLRGLIEQVEAELPTSTTESV